MSVALCVYADESERSLKGRKKRERRLFNVEYLNLVQTDSHFVTVLVLSFSCNDRIPSERDSIHHKLCVWICVRPFRHLWVWLLIRDSKALIGHHLYPLSPYWPKKSMHTWQVSQNRSGLPCSFIFSHLSPLSLCFPFLWLLPAVDIQCLLCI